jgi:hypothetical protein
MTFHAVLHGIVVMILDSESEGPGFEYWHSKIVSNYFWTIESIQIQYKHITDT